MAEGGLSDFGTLSYSTPILWYFVLLLNALFTAIGVGARDLRGPECFLNNNRTIGQVELLDPVSFYWSTCAIYPAFCAIVLLFLVLRSRKKDSSLFQTLLVTFIVGLGGTLYIGAANLYFLLEPEQLVGMGVDASTIRNILAASSILCTLLVIVIRQWFQNPHIRQGQHCTCQEQCCSYKHSRDQKCRGRCCNRVCTFSKCCNSETIGTEAVCRHGRNHSGCDQDSHICQHIEIICNCSGRCCSAHKQKLPWVKFLLLWSPWALVIATFDSLFISVTNEVSGDESVRTGANCTVVGRSKAAGGFYGATSLLLFLGLLVFAVYQIYNLYKKWKIEDVRITWVNRHRNCIAISYIVVVSVLFASVGIIFMAIDNNWPWICFARDNDTICLWVKLRVTLLAIITLCFCVIFFAVIYLFIWEWHLELSCAVLCARLTNPKIGFMSVTQLYSCL